jgi:hypothetical protein
VLLRRRERKIRQVCAGVIAAARWWPAGARGSRGALGAGQRGGNRSRARGEDDAWVEEKQEVDGGGLHDGGQGSCTGGRAGGAAEQRSRGGSEEEEEREEVRGTVL